MKKQSKKERMEINDFKKRIDILAMNLSLKENDRFYDGLELIFALYEKMIQNDQDAFFIDKERKAHIIESLKYSKQIFEIKKPMKIQELLLNLRSDDPTDFLIFPATFSVFEHNLSAHLCGLIFYRKNNHLLAIQVDKQRYFKQTVVSYTQIPLTKIEHLSKILFVNRDHYGHKPFDIFKDIEAISAAFQSIPTIQMKEQMTGNCVILELEATLKLALYHCQRDIFSIDINERVTPTWNLVHPNPTVEMRERFLKVVKGKNKKWNAQFDYIFGYYLYRKGYDIETTIIHHHRQEKIWYKLIETVFKLDPYILAIQNGNGDLPILNEAKLIKRLDRAVESLSELYEEDIKEVADDKLVLMLKFDGCLRSIIKERLAFIKIPVAKKMNEHLLLRIDERFQENYAEIKRRTELRKKEWGLLSDKGWLVQFAEKWIPRTSAYFLSSEIGETKQLYEFARRMDMLALTLSLKSNKDYFVRPENYILLFSTYIKMLKNDKDGFFIDKKRQLSIIQSVERTIALYRFDRMEKLKIVLENLRNNDPTDFMLFPTSYSTLASDQAGHVCGLTVYKKDDQFLVMQVDKKKEIGAGAVSYVMVSATKVEELSNILFSARELLNFYPYGTLIKIEALSHQFKKIPAIKLEPPTTNNYGVSGIETSLRLILFNCNDCLFELVDGPKITPMWNNKHKNATFEMQKRFLHAMKEHNREWNKNFDYVFGYCLFRNSIYAHAQQSGSSLSKDEWYRNIRSLYIEDPYIKLILNRGGSIPPTVDEQITEKILKVAEAPGTLYQREISEVDLSDLHRALLSIRHEISLITDRNTYTQIPIAKEIIDSSIDFLQEKTIEIQKEINHRNRIEKFNHSNQISKQWIPLPWHNTSRQAVHTLATASEEVAICSSRENRFSYMLSQVKHQAKVTSKDLARKPAINELKRQ
ncbi:hypothetical protein [Enterococcus mundtii]|uniref:hypothetical protein n=1 Tax=Enterococcus mundtii TaxID=53346 RepID=UPI000DFFF2DB|nr:hypothetical protein [Enterococcus mundtii]STD27117.1 Uncharacterised protein [Enterococcus mundtii]